MMVKDDPFALTYIVLVQDEVQLGGKGDVVGENRNGCAFGAIIRPGGHSVVIKVEGAQGEPGGLAGFLTGVLEPSCIDIRGRYNAISRSGEAK